MWKSVTNANGDRGGQCYTDGNRNRNSNCDCHGNGHGNPDSHSNDPATGDPDTQASSHTAASQCSQCRPGTTYVRVSMSPIYPMGV